MMAAIVCTVGGIALILTAVAMWWVALVRQEERAELEGERISQALALWQLGPVSDKKNKRRPDSWHPDRR